jgi:hypothetical protein
MVLVDRRGACVTARRSTIGSSRRAAVVESSGGEPVSPARNRVEVMHGVNLDMLGRRDPAHYGTAHARRARAQVVGFARELELEVHCFQTNSEREFVEHLHGLTGRPTACC